MTPTQFNVRESQKALCEKKISSLELTKACLERIEKIEPQIAAFISVCKKEALNQAKKADTLISQGETKPLLGLPISLKDNFNTQGIETTAASDVLSGYIPPYDATVVNLLKEAGAVIIGKTNMDAWAHGSSTETSDFGATKNPWDKKRLPGGSSGGSAASVAADEVIASIGSETAGSIRQPAAWCGVVGLKPTYGRVSRYGVIAMASSLDSPGPVTKTVEDSALILNILAGKDKFDATTSPTKPENYLGRLGEKLSGIKIGISNDYFKQAQDDVNKRVQEALKVFEKLGASVKEIKLFDPQYAISVYTIIQRAEVSSNLARYDGIRFGQKRGNFHEEAKRRIMLGTYVLSAGYYDQYYNKAQKVRTIIVEDFKRAFKDVDLIVGPTSPSTALPLGASKGHPMFGEMADVLVEPSSIAGLPGINIPCGFSTEGLPIGMQIIGPQFSESLILNAAHMFEQNTSFHKSKPNI